MGRENLANRVESQENPAGDGSGGLVNEMHELKNGKKKMGKKERKALNSQITANKRAETLAAREAQSKATRGIREVKERIEEMPIETTEPAIKTPEKIVDFSELEPTEEEKRHIEEGTVSYEQKAPFQEKPTLKSTTQINTEPDKDWSVDAESKFSTPIGQTPVYQKPKEEGAISKFITAVRNRWDASRGKSYQIKTVEFEDKEAEKRGKATAAEIKEGQLVKKEEEKIEAGKSKFEKWSEAGSGPSKAEIEDEISKAKASEKGYWARQAAKIEGTTKLPEHIMEDLIQVGNKPSDLVNHFMKHAELISPDVIKYFGKENKWLDQVAIQKLADARIKELEDENAKLGWTALFKKNRNKKEIVQLIDIVS